VGSSVAPKITYAEHFILGRWPTGSSVVRRGTAHVLALAAWQRDDVHDAMRWLGGITRGPIDQSRGQWHGRGFGL